MHTACRDGKVLGFILVFKRPDNEFARFTPQEAIFQAGRQSHAMPLDGLSTWRKTLGTPPAIAHPNVPPPRRGALPSRLPSPDVRTCDDRLLFPVGLMYCRYPPTKKHN